MFKQSSSRNQRTKGFKVKHALQVFVLVAVCVWLLYQVKHSHDKKWALEERGTKISTVVEDSHSDVLRFGRKDLPQVAIETNTETETHNDDEGNEEAEEGEPETKLEESEEEEVKGAGEDEIDENDQEGAVEEGEHSEELGDDEEKEGQSDELGLLTNQEQDITEANTQEAREEHYKGDDASSAVVRDDETTEPEARNSNEEQMENIEKDLDVNNKTIGAEDGLEVDESGVLPETSEIHLSNNTSMNDTSFVEGEHETKAQANSTLIEYDNQLAQQVNLTVEALIASTEMQNKSTEVVDTENDGSSLLNATISMNSDQEQNSTTEVVTGMEEVSNSTNDGSSNSQKILVEQAVNFNTTDGSGQLEKSSTTSSIAEEGDTTSEGGNAVQAESNDPLAKVDTVTEEERDARTDLSTLPEMATETKVEEVAAE